VCGSKGSSTTSSSYTPPPEATANYKYLAERAKNVAATPFQQYQGEMVAPMTPEQQAGIGQINAAANLAQPYMQAGAAYTQQGARQFDQNAANRYLSPYLNSVGAATMANLNETNAQQQQQLLGNNISRGAYGGDRSDIAQSELARQQGLANNQAISQLYNTGYGTAQQQFSADQARALAAGQNLGQLGTSAQSAAMQGGQAMMGAGAQEQAYRQAYDTANQQQFQLAQAYPFQTTQFLGNELLGIGAQSGGTSLTSQPGPNIGSQVLGGLVTLGSLVGSDERLKENMEPVGKTFDGQNIYKYNYKNDDHTMLGLSAQEVEKHNPDAVKKDGEGVRYLDYNKATHKAADRGHFADGGVTDWMGGAVHDGGLGRLHYASGESIPYTEAPSSALLSGVPAGGSVDTGARPLTLGELEAALTAVAAAGKQGKSSINQGIPEAPKPYEDTGLADVEKRLQNASGEQKTNLKNNLSNLFGGNGLTRTGGLGSMDNPNLYTSAIGPTLSGAPMATGGVVRDGYADGQVVQPQADTQGNQSGQSLIEKATGLNLDENARMGVLAAGLGMLSSRSPFFGVGVGEGATAGLGTYYNAKANDRAYANKQRELELTQQERNTQQQLADIAKGKAPSEINLAQANALEAVQRAKTGAGAMFEKTWIPGEGYYVFDKNNPMAPPVKITDEKMVPLGNVNPATIPNKATTVVTPSVSTGEPVKPPKVAEPTVVNPVVSPKPPEEPTKTTEWTPVTTVPTDYKYSGSMNLALTPGALEKAQASAEKMKADQDAKSQGAFDTLYQLDNLDHAFNNTALTGLLTVGQHIDERTQFASGINTMSRILGGKPMFDPNNLSALEEMAKDNKRLGFALSKSMGREPGFIVQQAISANPSAANEPLGFHRLTEGLRQAAQYEQDRNAFYDSYLAKFGHLQGANDLFTKLNPPEKYADKAILSTIDKGHVDHIRAWADANQGRDLSKGRAEFDKTWGNGAFKLVTGL
jgi:Chaperone of endosialidase